MKEADRQVKKADDPIPGNSPFAGMLADAGSFSEEEKREILERINSLVSASAEAPAAGAVKSVPRKRGLLLPLAVNSCAVLLVLVLWFVVQARYAAVQENLDLSESKVAGAGEEIIRGIRAESESMLEAKEQELESARRNLTDLAGQAESLRRTMDEQVKLREERLRNELSKALAEERAKLKETGVSGAELERRIREIESEKTARAARDLEAFRSESEETLRKKEEELAEAKRKADETARSSTTDRSELARLQDVREREKLVSDRINAYVQSVRDLVAKNDFDAAGMKAAELRSFILNASGQSVAGLPVFQQRKDAELSFVDAVESLIASRAVAVSELDRVRSAAAAGDSEARAVLEAENVSLSGELATARKTVDDLNGELDRLRSEQKRVIAEKTDLEKTLSRTVSENARALSRSGTEKTALETIRKTLEAENAALESVKKTLEAANRTLTAEKKTLESENASIGARFTELSEKLARSEDSLKARELTLAERQNSVVTLSRRVSSLEAQIKDAETKAYERSRTDLERLVLSFFSGERLVSGDGASDEDAFLSRLARAVISYTPAQNSPAGAREETLRLIGTVSNQGGGYLDAELIGPVQVLKGDTIRVRRKTPSGLEVVVASGTVEDVQSGLIRVRVLETLSGSAPLVLDPVYRVLGK